MKRAIVASLAVLSVGGSAIAADMGMPPPPVYTDQSPAPNWTGCYINAGGGGGIWNSRDTSTLFPGTPLAVASNNAGNGWLGVAGAGCDYEFRAFNTWNVVVGAFGDFDLMDLHGVSSHPSLPAGGVEGDITERSAWAGGLRLGLLITPNLLGYTNGGYTGTHFGQENTYVASTGVSTGAFIPAHDYNGWFLGGGTEYALNWSWLPINGLFWRSEYRIAYYEADNVPFVGTAFGEHTSKSAQTIFTELLWRFNWAGPLGARD